MGNLRKVECKWCHEVFTTDDGRLKYCCPECADKARLQKARDRFRIRYYVTHREEELARQRKRYRDNPEKEKARSAEWGKQNPERWRETKRNWYHAHKEAAQCLTLKQPAA